MSAPTATGTFEVRYPYTGEVIGEAPLLSREQVRRAFDTAASVRVTLDRHERAGVLERVAARIEEEAQELARRITLESGLCLADTRYEAGRAADVFRFAARATLEDDGQAFVIAATSRTGSRSV